MRFKPKIFVVMFSDWLFQLGSQSSIMTHTSVAPDTEQMQELDQEPSIRQIEIQMDNQGWHGKKDTDVLYVNLHWEVSGHTYIFSGCHKTPFKLIVVILSLILQF